VRRLISASAVRVLLRSSRCATLNSRMLHSVPL